MDIEITLSKLRHAYMQLKSGSVKDQPQFAEGLIAPVIRELEEIQVARSNRTVAQW